MERTFMAQWSQLQRKLSSTRTSACWNPNTDVYECPEGLVIRVEVAGVPADEMVVQLEEHSLIVRGERPGPCSGQTAEGVRYRQMEIEYGSFERVIALPFGVDGAAARAIFQNGFLEIRLPRSSDTKPTRIQVT